MTPLIAGCFIIPIGGGNFFFDVHPDPWENHPI